jgi:putative ABC transport system permease protein
MYNYKFYIRNLLKNKVFTTITIGSFAVSIAVIILLTSFLVSEFGYDSHLKNVERIYRVKASKNEASVPEQSRDLLLNKIPEIETFSNFLISWEPVVYNENNFNANVINSDEGLFSILPIEFVLGSPKGVFGDKKNVVITESLSKRIFGNEIPIGKTLNISYKEDVQVVAVIKDFPEKSTLSGDMICSADLKLRFSRSCFNDNCTYFYKSLVLLKPGVSDEAVSSKLTPLIPKFYDKDDNEYSLISYKNVYFDTSLRNDNLTHANVKLVRLLIWLTVVLLILAVFNYINLSVAHNTNRLKEFGIKQTLGARNINVFIQFIGEAFFTTLAASFAALLIAWLIQPLFVRLFGKEFPVFGIFSSPGLILVCLATLAGIALVSAAYPAWVATKVQAKDLLQKKGNAKAGAFDLRKSLNIAQFAASIVILVSLMVITRQVKYAKNLDFGFETGQLIKIPVHWKAASKIDVLKERLNSIPGVESSCFTHGTPGEIFSYNQSDEHNNTNEPGKVSNISSDYSFVETFGLKILEGRNFYENDKNNICLINKTAMKQTGWESFEGKNMFGFEVVGLLDDFHYESLYNKIGALMITNQKDVSHFNIRIRPQNMAQTLQEVEKGFKEVLPDYGFSFQFYDDYLDSMYQQEEKRADSIRVIAIIAILISCVGLIGLVEFSTKRRIKEIGIRKVNGARISEVLVMLNKDFVRWVAIAFVIATPIAYYAMQKWLENFAYKTSLSWWIFALAGLLALGIALLTVSWQSWKAATRNPVEALRYE